MEQSLLLGNGNIDGKGGVDDDGVDEDGAVVDREKSAELSVRKAKLFVIFVIPLEQCFFFVCLTQCLFNPVFV